MRGRGAGVVGLLTLCPSIIRRLAFNLKLHIFRGMYYYPSHISHDISPQPHPATLPQPPPPGPPPTPYQNSPLSFKELHVSSSIFSQEQLAVNHFH